MNIRYFIGFLILLFEMLSLGDIFSQTLKINEFMAANSSTIKDPDYNEYADWIELFNYGNAEVNLRNFYITDNLNNPQKYKFTSDVIVPAGGYVIIWTDDRNTGVHTNFKLSASGESIGLYNPTGAAIDIITFGEQADDISFGRFPDSASSWFYFSPATPGSENLEINIYNRVTKPVLSITSGFYTTTLNLSISHPDSNVIIKFTKDGSIPKQNSSIFSTPIIIDSTTVIRTAAFKVGFLESKTVTATYFINETTQLPVFSLATNPENFFSDTSGIYVTGTNGITGNCSTVPRNWNQDWERPVDIEFFEAERSTGFTTTAGVQIFGGCSRLYAMKSLAFYFRGLYGVGKLNYKLFPWLNLNEYNNFILRSSAQDWWRTMFRDGMVQTLIGLNTNLAIQSYRPSVVFLNGQYWGIHNLREKLNEHYLASHYGVNEDSVDIVELSKSVVANNGDLIAYNSMINFVSNNDMSLPANYEYIKSIVDIDDYIDYHCVQIYSANGDWPGSNVKLWRERKPGSKWRWMVYDLDFTFGGNAQGMYNTNTIEQATAINGPEWPNPPWSTLILRKLLENGEFRNEFIQRFAAHVNTTFQFSKVISLIDSLSQKIAAEIPRHKVRWPQSITMGNNWTANVNVMKDFASKRPNSIIGFFNTKFGISGVCSLIVGRNKVTMGKVFTNSLEVIQNDSINVFFKNIPIRFKAVANPGYRFVRWEGASTSAAPELILSLNVNGSLKAIFEEVISGINDEVQPNSFMLSQNFPNPFNPSTTISYGVPALLHVSLRIFDILGREVKVLVNEPKEQGYYEATFDGADFPSGIYFAKMVCGRFTKTIKMNLLK
ncbi:MAG: CotH kinase family protein [Ignavibacteriaceae bacterium]